MSDDSRPSEDRRCKPNHLQRLFAAVRSLGITGASIPERTPGYVYVLQANSYYKIGRTTDLGRRMKQLSIQLPFEAVLVCAFQVAHANVWERAMHQMFSERRKNGEWFELTDADIEDLFALFASVAIRRPHEGLAP